MQATYGTQSLLLFIQIRKKKYAATSLLKPERRLDSTAFAIICKMAEHTKPSHCTLPSLLPHFPLGALVNNPSCHGSNWRKKLMQVGSESYTTSGGLKITRKYIYITQRI
jgi:hypothetical protein